MTQLSALAALRNPSVTFYQLGNAQCTQHEQICFKFVLPKLPVVKTNKGIRMASRPKCG